MRELMLGNELTLRSCQLSDAGVGHFYQGLNSIVLGVPTAGYCAGGSFPPLATPVYTKIHKWLLRLASRHNFVGHFVANRRNAAQVGDDRLNIFSA